MALYVRMQATYVGRLGVPVGVFVAVDQLRRRGVLSAAEEARHLDITPLPADFALRVS